MMSAVPRMPMATLGAVAPSGPAAAGGRVTSDGPAGTVGVPMLVVAGEAGCGKTSVANALLGASPEAPAATSSCVIFHHGEEPRASAFVPGRRASRPLSVEQVRAGDAGMLVAGGPGRPPRRVEVQHPADLLRHVTLVDTPGAGGFDRTYTEIVLDMLDPGAALLFVTAGATALTGAQLDFIAEVEQRGIPVTFVLTKIDSCPQWPAVLVANQKLVHDHAPRLATSPWYAVSTVRGCDEAAPAAVEEAARGLAGLGVGALRRAFTEPAPGERAPHRTSPAGGSARRPAAEAPSAPAPRVDPGLADAYWSELLDREIETYRGFLLEQLATDLAAVRDGCARATGTAEGRARLAYVFDRELHGLSVRTTRTVDESATAIMRTVFGQILEGPPDRAAVRRIRCATRRAVEATEGDPPEWDRALLVTATAGVAVTTGRGVAGGFSAVAPRPVDAQLLPPIVVGLSASCYSARRDADDPGRCLDWLDKTVRVLEATLGQELTQRFEYLREALAVAAADTVDHGVLLT